MAINGPFELVRFRFANGSHTATAAAGFNYVT